MLLQELKNKPFCNDLHYFLIASLLLFISFKLWYFFILLFLFLIFIYKKTKLLIPIAVVLAILVISYSLVTISLNAASSNNLTGQIIDRTENGYILKVENSKYLLYTSKPLNIGDNITCEVSFYSFSKESYQGDFNYQDYLYSQGIKAYGRLKSYTLNSSGFNINVIKYNMLDYFKAKLEENTYSYVEALVFGENNLSDELKEGYSMLGMAHILAISGMHIYLISKLIDFLMLKIFRIPNSNISILIISIYTLILGFKPSVLRAFLFILIGKLNNKGYIKYTKLDILSISFILILAIRPYMFYQSGFLLTFLVSFILIFMSDFLKTDNKIKRLYLSNIIIYFVTLPITIGFYNKISIYSILLGPVLSILLIYLILPLAFISAIFTFNGFEWLFKIINSFILGLIKYNFTINIPSLSNIAIVFFYIILVILLIKLASKRSIIVPTLLLSIFFIIVTNVKLLNPYNNVTFLSCGQGDSCLIELKKNQGNILIDAFNSYDYLLSKGITHLNYIVITHSDIDHLGDLDLIINNIDYDYVIYDKYDEILSSYDLDSFIGVDYNYSFSINNIEFNIISPMVDLDDVNANSLALRFSLDNYTYLFCGDIAESTEEYLIANNVDLSCDILKVAHHGSNTSTSKAFLDLARPKYAVISAGLNNKYGFPNEEVLARINSYAKCYITYMNGNITFSVKNNKLEINSFY